MNPVLLLVLNAAVLTLMYLYFNHKIHRRLFETTLIEELRKEVGDLILELNRTTERNIGLLEDKIRSMKDIIDTADKKMMLLGREKEKQDLSSRVYSDILMKRAAAPKEEPVKDKKSFSVEEVLALHRKGISAALIAAKLGTTVGEVELAISLKSGKDWE